ncbi:MAG: peptide chain release factor N(5)-glutamine methyltransferase [Patescibacteria group bacterium]
MTLGEAQKKAQQLLKTKKISSPQIDSELILRFVLKKSKEYLFTYPEKKLTTKQEKTFFSLIKKRSTNFPVAYLLQKKEFFGHRFFVNANVLVPRPETELLVEASKKILTENKKIQTIAEIGTGSGCLIISLFLEMKNKKRQWLAVDKSASALCVAKKNSRQLNAKIKFIQGDLLKPLKNKKIDLLVANLPYLDKNIAKKFKTSAQKSLLFEPKIALYAPNHGLALFEKLFHQISQLTHQPQHLLLEIGHDQAEPLQKITKKILPNYRTKTHLDWHGFDRILHCEKF